MLESLLSDRFRGTTVTYDALIIALENMILDESHDHAKLEPMTPDTSSPMDIRVAAKDESDETRDDKEQRIADVAGQACSAKAQGGMAEIVRG